MHQNFTLAKQDHTALLFFRCLKMRYTRVNNRFLKILLFSVQNTLKNAFHYQPKSELLGIKQCNIIHICGIPLSQMNCLDVLLQIS